MQTVESVLNSAETWGQKSWVPGGRRKNGDNIRSPNSSDRRHKTGYSVETGIGGRRSPFGKIAKGFVG
jgi:hypothetical protein